MVEDLEILFISKATCYRCYWRYIWLV